MYVLAKKKKKGKKNTHTHSYMQKGRKEGRQASVKKNKHNNWARLS